jgi:hypothetical protein
MGVQQCIEKSHFFILCIYYARECLDVISKARSTAVRFEMSMEIQAKDIVCQFDQIPLPWHMWVSN